MSISLKNPLSAMSKRERNALYSLETRDARERDRIAPLLNRCITLASEWTNQNSLAFLYTDSHATAMEIVDHARLAGFRDVKLYRTAADEPRPDFTVQVETDPRDIAGPNNMAGKLRDILVENFAFQPPVRCNWIGGSFTLTLDNRSDAEWLQKLAAAEVLVIKRINLGELVNLHFHVTVSTDCAIKYRASGLIRRTTGNLA